MDDLYYVLNLFIDKLFSLNCMKNVIESAHLRRLPDLDKISFGVTLKMHLLLNLFYLLTRFGFRVFLFYRLFEMSKKNLNQME